MSPELDNLKRDLDLLVAELRACGAMGEDIGHLHCPWHGEDNTGSLSAFTSKDDGTAMFKCHACDAKGTIVDARVRKLKCNVKEAIKSLVGDNGPKPSPAKHEAKEIKVYKTFDELKKRACYAMGKDGWVLKREFHYENPSNGNADLVAMRFERVLEGKTQKTFRQCHYDKSLGGFVYKGSPNPPIYRRKEIANSDIVVVVEGEGKADLLLSMGIAATCSPMGAKSASGADWTPLRDKKVIIWRDFDDPGMDYQSAVIAELTKIGIGGNLWAVNVESLGLEESEDVVDYAKKLRIDGMNDDAIPEAIHHVIRNARRTGALYGGITLKQLNAYDTENDPTLLLGKRWICEGGACLVAGQTGIGKSSLAMQAAITWAAGKSFFGITPIRPLKSMFLQAENDLGDLAEQAQGVLKGMNLGETLEDYEDRLLLFDEDRLAGEELLQRLQSLVSAYRPDLVWIDPLHAYIGGDINDAEVCSKFLRRGLNPIAHLYKCGIFILHHTKKPSMDIVKKFSMGDFSYFGAGSAELANWPRAILVLRQLEEADKMGEGFQLIGAKRGKRAGLTTSDNPFDGAEQGNQFVVLKHSKVGICWEPREEQQETEDQNVIKSAEDLDVEIAVEKVWKAMELNHNYSEKDLRKLFAFTLGIKTETARKRANDGKGLHGRAWLTIMKSFPVNKSLTWCRIKTSEDMPELKIPGAKHKAIGSAVDEPAQAQDGSSADQPAKEPTLFDESQVKEDEDAQNP